MNTMTIVTLGGPLGAQAGYFTVIGIKKGVRLCLVAGTALFHHGDTEPFGVGAGDGVGGMAIFAGRQLLFGLVVSRPMDTGSECLLDAVVADSTCVGDVGAAHF